MRWAFLVSMGVAGFALAFQAAINSRLREAVASPVLSAAISFGTGAVLLWCCVGAGFFGGVGAGARGLASAPVWSLCGGLLGAFYVLATILAVPKLGAALTIAVAILGQQCAALLLDSTGWLGVPRVPLSFTRLLGAFFVVLGVALLQWQRK
jgi:transporter family-2 protein